MAEMFANADFARATNGGRTLDVGCGTGALVRVIAVMIRTGEIVGVDPAQSFVDYARTQVATLSGERREALRQGLRRRLLGDRPDGPFVLQAKALAVRGTVPS